MKKSPEKLKQLVILLLFLGSRASKSRFRSRIRPAASRVRPVTIELKPESVEELLNNTPEPSRTSFGSRKRNTFRGSSSNSRRNNNPVNSFKLNRPEPTKTFSR